VSPGLLMEDEVIIAGIKPKIVRFKNSEGERARECSYDLELYDLNRPILRRPEYLAARGKNSSHIQLIVKIDQSKSDFERGLIVPEGKPDKVLIHLKTKDESLEDKIWYTSFRKLLTHFN